jgi:hypothetical protein
MNKNTDCLLWMVALFRLAAYIPARSRWLVPIAIAFFASTVVVIPLHFWRAWRRSAAVPNQREYAVWVGIETIGTCGAVLAVTCGTSR